VFEKLKQGLQGIIEKISKTGLTEKDLEPLIWDLQMQLIASDVSVQVAEKVCEELKKRLIGTDAPRFGNKSEGVKNALKESIETVMQTNNTIDVLNQFSI
jgi:fused signal recognition particle receptor